MHVSFSVADKNGCPKPFYQTAHTTAKTTITCDYGDKCKHRFFCKEKNSICENILSSASNRRFKFTETSRAVNISISHVFSQDAGVYWCGGESADNTFILRQIHVEVKAPLSLRPWSSAGKEWSTHSGSGTSCCPRWRSLSISGSFSWVTGEGSRRSTDRSGLHLQ
uniref:Immunoglobulin V-set domain-containing protein n=1 Tax=Amphilophus citrinellus TaxID=61819 RepID=A0A3Q0RUM9_AMPCI